MISEGIVTLTWQGNTELPRTIGQLAQNSTIQVYMHFSKPLFFSKIDIHIYRDVVQQLMLIAIYYFQKNDRIHENFSTTFLKYYVPLKTMNYCRESNQFLTSHISNQRLKSQTKTLYFNSAIMFKLHFTDIKKELNENGILGYFHCFCNNTASCDHPPTIIWRAEVTGSEMPTVE